METWLPSNVLIPSAQFLGISSKAKMRGKDILSPCIRWEKKNYRPNTAWKTSFCYGKVLLWVFPEPIMSKVLDKHKERNTGLSLLSKSLVAYLVPTPIDICYVCGHVLFLKRLSQIKETYTLWILPSQGKIRKHYTSLLCNQGISMWLGFCSQM